MCACSTNKEYRKTYYIWLLYFMAKQFVTLLNSLAMCAIEVIKNKAS